ncbi:hypothetical protein KXW91_005398 [Aspergillus fumigatus]|nr:hypothetical protein KXX67_005422 [Aspergillus fumigatus]KAH1629842.1 hypothetical protein KXX39_003330 [Aspergillus fumigatus]KAH2346951.1 hypothetical protein KXW91_005398 [Aspergillus fumigatus]KAH2451768.1 hypothetical protein KXW63_005946 [Aspergillus fumigatus]KAH2834335.1 hypothetical protein KXW76_004001 [Aspergillus fumigatus]
MKTAPQPASIHDVDEDDNILLHSKRSATRVMKGMSPSSSPPRSHSRVNSNSRTSQKCIFGKSICRGPIENMVKECGLNRDCPLTIFTRSQDQSRERNEVPGYRFRKVFFTDETEVLNPDAIYNRGRYVRLTAFIAEKEETHPDPRIYVEQRVYQGNQEMIMIHELIFGGMIQVGIEYVFTACGDEDVHLGKRDLRLTIKSLQQDVFDGYMHRAKYYGYDRKDTVFVSQYSLLNGLTYTIRKLGGGEESPCKVFLEADDLRTLVDAKCKMRYAIGAIPGGGVELLKLRFPGYGEYTEDRMDRGDLDLRIVYKG